MQAAVCLVNFMALNDSLFYRYIYYKVWCCACADDNQAAGNEHVL